MPKSLSPLRYPGGKTRLANFIKLILETNDIQDGIYVEAFAGGAGVALELLLNDLVSEVIINDVDPCIYSFWNSVIHHTDYLCQKIADTPVNLDSWHELREVVKNSNSSDSLMLGFATFFLNRTNRSGILNAGVIGGLKQTGKWKINARYNKNTLIERIQKISEFKDNITLHNLDVRVLIKKHLHSLPENSLVYLDPPYFNKGQKLYLNSLRPDDHILIKHSIEKDLPAKWVISYDNTPEIRSLYSNFRQSIYDLNYSAANHYKGSEVIIYSTELKIPNVGNPFKISDLEYQKLIKLEEILQTAF